MQRRNTLLYSSMGFGSKMVGFSNISKPYDVQVLVCGAELFTSNTAMLPAALCERRVSLAQLARNWAIAYSGVLHLQSISFLAGQHAVRAPLFLSARACTGLIQVAESQKESS